MKLDRNGVTPARLEEIRQFHSHGVYKKMPMEECWKSTGKKPMKVKWVDVNKGDEVNPEYRIRLVAKELKNDKREDLFAATPPPEAKKSLSSMAVTGGIGYVDGDKSEGMKVDFIDISRAYFQAVAVRNA